MVLILYISRPTHEIVILIITFLDRYYDLKGFANPHLSEGDCAHPLTSRSSKGKVVGTVSFGRDITERKKSEEQIKESLKQKLRNSNKQNKLLYYLIEGTRGG